MRLAGFCASVLGLALLLSLLLTGCPRPIPPPVPPQDADASAPAALDVAEFTCAHFCQRLDQLGCAGAGPTPEGKSCLEVCRDVVMGGPVTWDLRCRATAPTCMAMDQCR